MKHMLMALVVLVAGVFLSPAEEVVSPDVTDILGQARVCADQGEAVKAIQVLDGALARHPDKTFDRYALLNYKFELLTHLSRFREALAVGVEKANIVTSPRQALLVAEAYLKLGDLEYALDWLETSVKRGLLSYTIFNDTKYDPLRTHPRFLPIVETIKDKIGIGRPAKSFASMSIGNEKVSLSGFRGKVVLIDFWATWCPPCLKQLPFIKKYYNEFKDMDFAIVGAAEETDIGKLKAFLQTNDIEWPTIANDAGKYDELAALYAVKNIPASFLIDKKGILRHVNLTENELRTAILELTKE